MTIIITESFDGSSLLTEYISGKHGKFIPGLTGRQGGLINNGGAAFLSSSPARHSYALGIQCFSGQAKSGSLNCIFDPSEEDDVVVMGVALYGQFSSTTVDGIFFSEWRNVAGTATRIDHVKFNPNATNGSGQMDCKNAAGTTIGSFNNALTSAWKYLEIKVKVHDTAGTVDVRIDGVSVLSLTNQDTRNNATGATGLINCITFSNFSSGNVTFYLDDLYILNEQGSAPYNNFLGDITVSYLQTSAPGSNSNWSPSAGLVPNWDLVNDLLATAPTVTDFVYSSTNDQKDTYVVEDMPQVVPSTPLAVINYAYIDKIDTGVRTAALVVKLGANEAQSADQFLRDASNGGPQYLKQILQTKPGGGAWTVADVNAMEIGTVCRP